MVGIAEKPVPTGKRPVMWGPSSAGSPDGPAGRVPGPRYAIADGSEREQLAALVERLRPDMAVVSRWGLLSPELIRAFPLGILNTHLSLLPELRGKHPTAGALLAGLRRTGVSIQFMQEGIDTGPVLLQRPFPIVDGDREEEVTARGASLLAHMYRHAIAGIRTGRYPEGRWGSTGMECHFSWRRQFGSEPPNRLPVDWTAPAWLIQRVIRFRSCYTSLDGWDVTLRRARPDEAFPEDGRSGAPGEVLAVRGRWMRVGTGQGVAELEVDAPAGDLAPGVRFESARWPRWREFVDWVEALPREVKRTGTACRA